MFDARATRSQKREPAEDIRLGAVRSALAARGYPQAVSALVPHGIAFGYPPFPVKLPEYLTSEHPAALPCVANKLAVLVVQPIDDEELSRRAGKLLADRKLTSGPCRLGAGGTRSFPLRSAGMIHSGCALAGRVAVLHAYHDGPGPQLVTELVPLDGSWSRSLLETSYSSLPAVSADVARDVLVELDGLPGILADERRPPPVPTRASWLGR